MSSTVKFEDLPKYLQKFLFSEDGELCYDVHPDDAGALRVYGGVGEATVDDIEESRYACACQRRYTLWLEIVARNQEIHAINREFAPRDHVRRTEECQKIFHDPCKFL